MYSQNIGEKKYLFDGAIEKLDVFKLMIMVMRW